MTKSVTRRIQSDVADTYDEVVRSLKKMSQHLAEEGGDAATETAVSLVRAAVDLIEQAKDQTRSLARKAGVQVKEHPATAAAIAAAAIALIGLVVARRASAAS